MRKFTIFLAFFIFLGMQLVHAQDRAITGTVISSDDGLAIPGVAVMVKGTNIGTTTDLDGKYQLTVDSKVTTLIFSFMGMVTKEVQIGDKNVVDVVLDPDIMDIEGVVVTALGISREKKALGYSVQDLKGDEIAEARENNIVNALAGKIAGVQVTNSSGGVGSSSRIIIRGNSSFGNNQPLFVVDGTPILNSSSEVSQWGNGRDYGNATTGQDFGNAAMDIDPSNIESVSVLKGANAAALYGSRAANGVILITTKKGGKVGTGKKAIGVDFSTGVTFDNVYVIPKYQNKYGQGYGGGEYHWKLFQQDNPGVYSSYQEYAQNESFSYYNGDWGGVMDGIDESWGPRLDAGLNLAQFDSPYTFDANGNPVYTPTPWVSQEDNIKDFFETGITFSNNLAITGGTDKAFTRLSLGNTNQTGAIPNTDLKRTNIGFSGTVNLTKRLTAIANINYIRNKSDNIPGGGYDENNIMQSIGSWFGRQVNMTSLKDNWETLDAFENPYNWNRSYHNNPYWTVNKNTTSRTRDRIFGNVSLSYKLTDWLDVMGRVGTDFFNEYRKHLVADKSIESSYGGEFWKSQSYENETNADLIFTAKKDLTEDFTLNAALGTNYMNHKYHFLYMRAAELTVPDFYTISNVKGNASTTMLDKEYESNSIYGSATIGYQRFVYLDLTARNDWNSTLPKDNWSYFYPSTSLSFIFTEAFDIDDKILSYGKVRGSWAQVGSATSPYQTLATYSTLNFNDNPIDPFSGVTQYHYAYDIPPLDLEPEKTTGIEFGTDLKFLNNRLGIDFTYYNSKTTNQIMIIDVAQSCGFTGMVINAGEIQNNGVEIMLYGKILDSKDGLNWDIILNWAKNNNEVNELYGDLESYIIARSWGGVTVEARPGEPYGQIKGGAYVRDGNDNIIINPNTGIPVISAEPEVIGNILPDWTAGIRNSFSYKNIDFSFLFDMRKGGDIFSVTDWFGGYAGITEETADGNIREVGMIVDGVLAATNPDGSMIYDDDGNPIGSGQANNIRIAAQDYYEGYWGLPEASIIDGTFIKFREVVLGYDLPQKWMDGTGFLRSANIAFVGRNLALLYVDESNDVRIDPETGFGTTNSGMGIEQYQLPPTRSLGFRLRVIF
ncbi:MAG: SusC/RagA family TonB-linked outer membrane protein [Bacteroidales bacterium]|nr:SusC/RagA family TonB-linked outer membrane protein [Bacteroidales bacterium]